MKYILFLAYVTMTILPSDPQNTDPVPVLPSAMQLEKVLEIPVRETPEPIEDKAAPGTKKTFATLMAERSFKCRIL